MLHNDKDSFLKLLQSTAAQTGFPIYLLEKDYYLTIVLSKINQLSSKLVFKGGTCLNKVYYSYYRLSEDLDFVMLLPSNKASRTVRRNLMKPIKDSIKSYLSNFQMTIEDIDNSGHNESCQYIFYPNYDSVVLNSKQSVKLEISLRFNPIVETQSQKVNHRFLHPFTRQPLFDGGLVNCLSLKEIAAEKMRAAATRIDIAPRDFYDLGFLIKSGLNFHDEQILKIFKIKLNEDGFPQDLAKYKINMGRSDEEIAKMASRIPLELLDVLTIDERKDFDLKKLLRLLNETFKILN